MHSKILVSAVAGVLLAFAGTAGAATKTANFTVTAVVAKNCLINANPLTFGSFDGTTDVDQSTTIAVRCTTGTPYTVSLNVGAGSFANRTLADGAKTLSYNLYTNAARNVIWGDGTASTSTVGGTGAGIATSQDLTVYGRVPVAANANADAGTYTGTITASIVY